MSMRALLAVGLAAAAAVGARPLAAEDGVVLATGAKQSQVQPITPGPPGPRAPLRGNEGPRARERHAPPAGRPAWRWPLEHRPPLLRKFTAPANPYGPGHRGLDLGSPAATVVLAVAPGEVTHAGRVAGRGTVTVAHPGGISSTYEPVDPTVAEGALVAAGDPLGVLDVGGAVTGHCGAGACLHLGARRGPVYLDPLPLLLGGRVVLLPLSGVPALPRPGGGRQVKTEGHARGWAIAYDRLSRSTDTWV